MCNVLSIHCRSSSVSAMIAVSSANIRRAKRISLHFTPKLSCFISSIRPLMKRLNNVGGSRHPCLDVTGNGSVTVSLTLTQYSVSLYRHFIRSRNFPLIP